MLLTIIKSARLFFQLILGIYCISIVALFFVLVDNINAWADLGVREYSNDFGSTPGWMAILIYSFTYCAFFLGWGGVLILSMPLLFPFFAWYWLFKNAGAYESLVSKVEIFAVGFEAYNFNAEAVVFVVLVASALTYLALIGSTAYYWTKDYPEDEVKEWNDKVKEWRSDVRDFWTEQGLARRLINKGIALAITFGAIYLFLMY